MDLQKSVEMSAIIYFLYAGEALGMQVIFHIPLASFLFAFGVPY